MYAPRDLKFSEPIIHASKIQAGNAGIRIYMLDGKGNSKLRVCGTFTATISREYRVTEIHATREGSSVAAVGDSPEVHTASRFEWGQQREFVTKVQKR